MDAQDVSRLLASFLVSIWKIAVKDQVSGSSVHAGRHAQSMPRRRERGQAAPLALGARPPPSTTCGTVPHAGGMSSATNAKACPTPIISRCLPDGTMVETLYDAEATTTSLAVSSPDGQVGGGVGKPQVRLVEHERAAKGVEHMEYRRDGGGA